MVCEVVQHLDPNHQGLLSESKFRRCRGAFPEGLQTVLHHKGNLGPRNGLWTAKQLAEKRGGWFALASSTAPATQGNKDGCFLAASIFFIVGIAESIESKNGPNSMNGGVVRGLK